MRLGFMAAFPGVAGAFTWSTGRDAPHPSQPAWLQHAVLARFRMTGLTAA